LTDGQTDGQLSHAYAASAFHAARQKIGLSRKISRKYVSRNSAKKYG